MISARLRWRLKTHRKRMAFYYDGGLSFPGPYARAHVRRAADKLLWREQMLGDLWRAGDSADPLGWLKMEIILSRKKRKLYALG